MNIAILTGASSGLGIELFKELQGESLDQVWVIARREDKLKEICKEHGRLGYKILPMDITKKESIENLRELLENKSPCVKFLINNAGYGTIGDLADMEFEGQGGMVDLNVRALTEITTVALKFMSEGSKIINICSIASFVPNARMTVYSATKAYVMSFTKSLRYELKKKKINVTAVCPGPMKTEFLSVAGIDKANSPAFNNLPYCDPVKVARGAIRASKSGRCVYTPRFFYKLYRVLAKLLPHAWLMPLSKT